MAGREEAVVDASVVIKWFHEEENTGKALELREEHINGVCILLAPDLLIYEIANALRYKPNFSHSNILRAVATLIDLQIDIVTPGKELIERASELSYKYELSIYDSSYLALGELLGIKVYTADKKFFNKAKTSGILIFL